MSSSFFQRALLMFRSFLIGRKGLKEDLARFEEEGNQRFQKLVTEYAEHEVSQSSSPCTELMNRTVSITRPDS
jgi:hypothetical protein